VLATLVAASTAPRRAVAQPTEAELAEARRLFDVGKKAEEDDRWGEALEAFRKIASVKKTPQVIFHVALAEEHLGHLAAALAHFEEAEELARKEPDSAKQVLDNVPEHLEALRARTPTVEISVSGAEDYAVTIDGAPVSREALAAPIRLDPGKHTVVATGPGQDDHAEKDLFLVERAHQKLALSWRAEVDVPPPLAPVRPKPDVPVVTHGTKVPAIVAGSVGIASLIGAGVFLGLRQSSIAEVEASCRDKVNDRGCDPRLQPVADRGKTYTVVSAALAGVGVVGLGTGAALWLTVGRDKPGPRRVTFAPGFVALEGEL
jgi:hypothetical protein